MKIFTTISKDKAEIYANPQCKIPGCYGRGLLEYDFPKQTCYCSCVIKNIKKYGNKFN
jgi:hypothetical protein